ncbi:MAG: metallophosphoesterase family protein [Deltaproteobacteria bacterium]|nr:metallophosphoesterase family protein [Deltaproteobacteria bacterium]
MILLLGDIHANYPALKAVGDYIKPERFNRIINTGDSTVYCTFPNETIQWLREKNTISIVGNTDRAILRILKGKKLKKPKKQEKRLMYFWTSEILYPENKLFLKSLPRQKDLTVNGIRIGVFHGTVQDPDEQLFPSSPIRRFRDLAKNSPYRIHIMGNSHVPYHKIVNGIHFINPGSVGRMFDGDPRASFAVLRLSTGRIEVEHFRIPYPVEDVVNSLKNHRLPDIYVKMFQTGTKLN